MANLTIKLSVPVQTDATKIGNESHPSICNARPDGHGTSEGAYKISFL